jgi:Mn2+/Fe2+ NRAMP family transporter
MQSLGWVAVINGIVAVPVMALLMLMARDPRILGPFTVSRIWQVLGWVATGVMAIVTVEYLASAI